MALNHQPLLDSEWVKHAFILPPALRSGDFNKRDDADRVRQPTSADYTFVDSSLGGNYAINSPPQFTPRADVRYPGLLNRPAGQGAGRFWKEAHDDPGQKVHMAFGHPVYNSMARFFTNFYDARMARLANTGRTNMVTYNAGIALGFIVSLPLQPFIIGLTFASRVMDFVQRQSPSKWYYFRPSMYAYWSAVNTLANDIAINMGIIPRAFSDHNDSLLKDDSQTMSYDPAEFSRIMPDIYREKGGIDIMALSLRTQRIANQANQTLKEKRKSTSDPDELRAALVEHIRNHPTTTGYQDTMSGYEYFEEAVNAYPDNDEPLNPDDGFAEWGDFSFSKFMSYTSATKQAGAQFATFKVNHKGAVSESFSSQVKDSDVAQMVNSRVQDARNLRFTVMDGNILDSIGSFISQVGSFMDGALDSVKLGGLMTLAGNAFIDVPRHWENSTANLPSADYTIPLYNPYGNPISRFQNLIVPICMILAGGLPLSAGRAAYTSPFICQIFHQGRVQCQLGMITEIGINRGTGNVGWNANHDMLGAEITFTVTDMSSIMHAPIKGAFGSEGNIFATGMQGIATTVGERMDAQTSSVLGVPTGDTFAAGAMALTNAAVWDEGSAFTDYMAVLGGLSLNDTFYFQNRLNLNATKALQSFRSWRSPSNMAVMMGDDGLSRMLMQFGQGTSRFAE